MTTSKCHPCVFFDSTTQPQAILAPLHKICLDQSQLDIWLILAVFPSSNDRRWSRTPFQQRPINVPYFCSKGSPCVDCQRIKWFVRSLSCKTVLAAMNSISSQLFHSPSILLPLRNDEKSNQAGADSVASQHPYGRQIHSQVGYLLHMARPNITQTQAGREPSHTVGEITFMKDRFQGRSVSIIC